MRVLIAFGSKRGGTAGLADMIGDALRAAGCETVVSPATGTYDLTEFDAVIVASALYANRWHRDARRFVRRNTAALCEGNCCLAHKPPRGASSPTELAPAAMSRSVDAYHPTQGASPPQPWPKPMPATGATRPTSSVGWTRWWPSSNLGRLRVLEPVTRRSATGPRR